ncbi:hypothetical protein [Pseudoduganella albidiflava]|uniref:Thioredoxin domain-containing protein n=1 Tax=Pseudoduganella albidiflava TaxID=321983 RepID=A0A411WVN8_9BURK|nr:hypothetical protein [Pseudoduganella albidiflava]QBI00863.1 hypothetical protein EYF70_08400 [Pseudoduganella albidiflava]GGY30152.1 hypothetical protein GCM10007387_09720 [Pseudoduganella albidiflava]
MVKFLVKTVARVAPFGAVLLSTAAGAAQVTELKPSEVADFVARHEYAIVQVTSPDRKCGYCIDADKKFDKMAAAPAGSKFAFARVQYAPWREIPDFGKVMQVYGVPEQAVFHHGKRVGRANIYYDTPKSFYAQVEAALASPVVPGDGVVQTAPQPAPKPMTAAESADLRLMVRRDLLQATMDECVKRFPAGANRYRAAVKAWEAPRKDALDRGALVFVRGGHDPKQFAGEEIAALTQWMAGLGIGAQKKQEAADCDRMVAAMPDRK